MQIQKENCFIDQMHFMFFTEYPEYQIVFAVLLALLLRLHNLCVVYFARISSKLSTE